MEHPAPDYCFCFVCQAGALEMQSVLLALSLVTNAQCRVELVAAHPAQYGDLQPWVKGILGELGVHVIEIANDFPDYPIGNKFSCLLAANGFSEAKYVIFIDTDMICAREFIGVENIDRFPISVRIAGKAHLGTGPDAWRSLYAAFGLSTPAEILTTVRTGEETLPYFNSGFIAIHRGSAFPEAWLNVARKLYDEKLLPCPLRFLDQVALSVAIRQLGLEYQCLPEKYNSTPLIWEDAIFHHYHSLMKLKRNMPASAPFLDQAFARFPELGRHFAEYL